jgi:hypothetical protein
LAMAFLGFSSPVISRLICVVDGDSLRRQCSFNFVVLP